MCSINLLGISSFLVELAKNIAQSIKNVAGAKEGNLAAGTKELYRLAPDLSKAGGDIANALALDLIADVVGILPGMGGFAEVAQLKLKQVDHLSLQTHKKKVLAN